MDLGGAQDFSSVPSSSTMSSLHRGEGSVIVPHVRSQEIDGVVAESSKGKLLESLILGSSDDAILKAILRTRRAPFLLRLIVITWIALLRWLRSWM